MTTRMVHPEHGATHAYGDVDIEWHKKHGWVIEEPKKPEPVKEPEKRKPGRPPKGK